MNNGADGGSYVKAKTAGSNGRSSFVPPNPTPGPAAYTPNAEFVKQSPGTVVFGTSNRDREGQRYISELHSRALPPSGNPGPGTYRTNRETCLSSPRRRAPPMFGFGTAPQRTDERALPTAKVPGPVYNQDLPPGAPSFSFAPPGDPEMAMERRRDDGAKLFISPGHVAADRTTMAHDFPAVAPGAYDVSNTDALSPKRRPPKTVFGKSSRDALDSLNKQQQAAVPLAGTPAITPGAIYDLATGLSGKGQRWSKGVRSYSPEKGNTYAGPYIGRGHESMTLGVTGPGPGAYTVIGGRNRAVLGGLGDCASANFGSEILSPPRPAKVPGPGAYTPKQDALSRSSSAPAFSLGARTDNLRASAPASLLPMIPGPGSYEVEAAARAVQKNRASSYSMGTLGPGGRDSFVQYTQNPGPASYMPGEVESPKRKGYSFGVKERTVDEKSMVSVRYHGPLAAAEAMGTHSPGPGLYNTAGIRQAGIQEMPHLKFPTASRDACSKLYISRMHAEADGAGADAPGPGTYDHHQVDIADVTSRFKKAGAATFSTSQRFKSNYMTF